MYSNQAFLLTSHRFKALAICELSCNLPSYLPIEIVNNLEENPQIYPCFLLNVNHYIGLAEVFEVSEIPF